MLMHMPWSLLNAYTMLNGLPSGHITYGMSVSLTKTILLYTQLMHMPWGLFNAHAMLNVILLIDLLRAHAMG